MNAFCPQGTIASLAPTVAHLFGVAAPALASEPALEVVAGERRRMMAGATIKRCLVFCPDALGAHIWPACDVDHRAVITRHAPLCVPLLSVVPAKTPVCFASMFTGGQPAAHGIRRYERPVLKCDTLLDALVRVGRRTAIVAVANSSMDLIFRERVIDYFSEANDAAAARRAGEVLDENRHELVVAYQQEYDDLLHETEPFSEACLAAVGRHVASFVALVTQAAEVWRSHDYAVIFAPDHGAHLDPATGHGNHGDDTPADMHLYHWYGIRRGLGGTTA